MRLIIVICLLYFYLFVFVLLVHLPFSIHGYFFLCVCLKLMQLEGEATSRAIRLASFVNTPLYVVHVMSIDAMEEIAKARKAGAIFYSTF